MHGERIRFTILTGIINYNDEYNHEVKQETDEFTFTFYNKRRMWGGCGRGTSRLCIMSTAPEKQGCGFVSIYMQHSRTGDQAGQRPTGGEAGK